MNDGIVASCVNPVESQVLRGKKNPILFSVFAYLYIFIRLKKCMHFQKSNVNSLKAVLEGEKSKIAENNLCFTIYVEQSRFCNRKEISY
jgi:hypothetical protein